MSRIVTFYSYKGGVGRTFTLANLALLLAKRGKKVLLMDWDLEAPGLHRYFKQYFVDGLPQTGLIQLLHSASQQGDVDWRQSVAQIQVLDYAPLSIITSGSHAADYVDQVRAFSWADFFERKDGGTLLERWRQEWGAEYDYVLIDSRTGVTDTGGVCTVFLPDILVLVFSANEQSFDGAIKVANGVQEARRNLAVQRAPVAILPVPGRFDGRDEIDEAKRWLDRFALELKPFYDVWLPKQFQPRQMLELTKIPYITKFSFGEPLPVLTNGVTDPELPGFYLENIARLLVSDFADAGQLLSGGGGGGKGAIGELRSKLGQLAIPGAAIDRVLGIVEAELASKPQLKTMVVYYPRDRALAEELAEVLKSCNVNVWFYDWEISLGDHIQDLVAQAMQLASSFVVCVGPNFSTSQVTDLGIDTIIAFAKKNGRRVIPVLLPQSVPLKPPGDLFQYLHLDMRQGMTPKAINQLVSVITNSWRR